MVVPLSTSFPITAETTCKLLGKCATPELPKEVYTLMNLYNWADLGDQASSMYQ
ncbi:MAG: hypothetical protein NWE89_02040 [Candidatus Bathyarchaeota archaeon]|nr:hypothetical protein [Candidatus Bathyarchaeota archaeon]